MRVSPELIAYAVGKLHENGFNEQQIRGFLENNDLADPNTLATVKNMATQMKGNPETQQRMSLYEERLQSYMNSDISPDTKKQLSKTLQGG